MTDQNLLHSWSEWAAADARRRGQEGLGRLLERLARATAALREADWNSDASTAPFTEQDRPGA